MATFLYTLALLHPFYSLAAFTIGAPFIIALATSAAEKATQAAFDSIIDRKRVNDDLTADVILRFLDRNARSFKISKETYDLRKVHIRPLGEERGVMYLESRSSFRLFLYRGAPILFVPQRFEQSEPVRAAFIFLKGTVDWNTLILAAARAGDEEVAQDRLTAGRNFRVIRHFGASRPASRGSRSFDNDVDPPDADVSKHASHYVSADRPIGWSPEDLGVPTPDDPLGALSLGEDMKRVIRDVNFWFGHRKWYEERQVTWRRGILLHGEPGSGKTSLVRAIAQDLDVTVHTFDLASMDNQDFISSWEKTKSFLPRIVLLEDFDTVFHLRDNVVGSPLSFDTILNVLDGVERENGLLLFVTTNNIIHIDKALGTVGADGKSTRPGRIDVIVELKGLDHAGRVKIARRILQDDVLSEQLAAEGVNDTAAIFQERCCQHALGLLWHAV